MSIEEFADELGRQTRLFLDAYPSIPHKWTGRGDLRFAASSDAGFDVIVHPRSDGVEVATSVGLRETFGGPPTRAVKDALLLASDLLASWMRIREYRAESKPYRWQLERNGLGGWAPVAPVEPSDEDLSGRHAERILQNDHLPVCFRDEPAISDQLIMQRVRNWIIVELELTSSFELQRRFALAAPWEHVPSEVINRYEDRVGDESWIDAWGPPVFSDEEVLALRRFHRTWDEVSRRIPNPLPPLEVTLQLPAWQELKNAAAEALAVFRVRGRLPSDYEISTL